MTKIGQRCPTCNSPSPEKHPAMQYEGEVQPCPDPWHEPETTEMLARHGQKPLRCVTSPEGTGE